MQQKVYKNDNDKPFVGLIVGPYSTNIDISCECEVRCFYIVEGGEAKGKRVARKPYNIQINMIPQDYISVDTFQKIVSLFQQSLNAPDRVDLTKRWRGKVTKSEKLHQCLRSLFSKNQKAVLEYNPIEIISNLEFADDGLRNRLLESYNPSDSIFENLTLAINGPDIATANTEDLICLNSAQDSLDLLEKISTVYDLVRSPAEGLKSLGGKAKKGKAKKKRENPEDNSDSEEAKVAKKRPAKSNKSQKNKRERTEDLECDDENKF